MAALTLSAPQIPVVHNVHARTETDPEIIKQRLVEQIYSPVLWTSCVRTMVDTGIRITLECGPGKVLSGLSKRIDKSLSGLAIETPAGLEQALAET